MQETRQSPIRWLRALFYIHLLGCVFMALGWFSVMGFFPLGYWYNWFNLPMGLGSVVCLLLLSGRYRLSGIAKALGILLPMLWPKLLHGALMPFFRTPINMELIQTVTTVVNKTASILGILAVILECSAHARIAPSEKRNWYIFLACSIATTLLSAAIIAIIQPMLQELSSEQIRLWNGCATAFNLAVKILYIIFLHHTIRALEKK